MAHFRKGSREAKAWGARMRSLRHKGPKKEYHHKTNRRYKHRIRYHLKHVAHAIRHPIRTIRHRRHIKKEHKRSKIDYGSAAAAVGLVANILNPFITNAPAAGVTPPSPPPTPPPVTIPANPANPPNITTASNSVIAGTIVTITGGYFSDNALVTVTMHNDIGESSIIKTPTTSGIGTINVAFTTYSNEAATYSFVAVDNNTGLNSNTIIVTASYTAPAVYPYPNQPTLSINATAVQIITANENFALAGGADYDASSGYQGAGVYAWEARQVISSQEVTSAAAFSLLNSQLGYT